MRTMLFYLLKFIRTCKACSLLIRTIVMCPNLHLSIVVQQPKLFFICGAYSSLSINSVIVEQSAQTVSFHKSHHLKIDFTEKKINYFYLLHFFCLFFQILCRELQPFLIIIFYCEFISVNLEGADFDDRMVVSLLPVYTEKSVFFYSHYLFIIMTVFFWLTK